jgi:hypothetical protein
MHSFKIRLFFVVVALVALALGSASASPGKRTTGTGSRTECKDSDNNVVGVIDSYSPTYLWPPNHKQTPVTIKYTDSDNDGDAISVGVTNIKHDQAADDGSNELRGSGSPSEGPDYTIGSDSTKSGTDGSAVPDFIISAGIRAERSGTSKAGRTYTITVTCTDSGGNANGDGTTGEANLCIFVPHDQGQHKTSSCPTATTPLG